MPRNYNRGTGLQFQHALENQIANLEGGTVESATNTANIGLSKLILGAEQDDAYLVDLIDKIKSELYWTDDTVHVEIDNNNVYFTVLDTSEEFTVPFADLSFDRATVDQDVAYVVENIGPEVGVKS